MPPISNGPDRDTIAGGAKALGGLEGVSPSRPFAAKPEYGLRFAKAGEFEVAQGDEFLRQTAGERRRCGSPVPIFLFFNQPRSVVNMRAFSHLWPSVR